MGTADLANPAALGEEAFASDARRFRVVAIVAAVAAVPFIVGHAFYAIVSVPIFVEMYADMGGQMPALFEIATSLGGFLAPLLVVIDIGVFAFMYVLARRYWIGLLFAPIFIYAGIGAALSWVMYLPMYEVITLVE